MSDTPLELGRTAFEQKRWLEAFIQLQLADQDTPLDGTDLERLALAAHLSGRDSDATDAFERTYAWFIAANDPARAARNAFWLAVRFMQQGEVGRVQGWFGRAQRLLDEYDQDCVERGYVLIPLGLQRLGMDDPAAAREAFEQAVAVGERFADQDLIALGRLGCGQSAIKLGEVAEGTSLLDEVMVAVSTGEISAVIAGITYCAVIELCQGVFDIKRAQEWTEALSRWCESQPELVPFRGQCLAYRAEIMSMHGTWSAAMDELRRAEEFLARPPIHPAIGIALYQRAELHRLRGAFAQAEEAYREASRWGRPPEPGLALLRLSQGRVDAAEAMIRRALDEAQDRPTRARILPAFVEIVLVASDLTSAGEAAAELASIAGELQAPLLQAAGDHAEGSVRLVQGEPLEAVGFLRRAWAGWQRLEVPYEAARVRVSIGRACSALGDLEAAEMEYDAARWSFRQLGAAVELAALDALLGKPSAGPATGLTLREVEILRVIAEGRTNREIAETFGISEKTVARHVSNILAKLDMPSRAAATAHAYREGLL